MSEDEMKCEAESTRGLDAAKTSSMDIQALNNVVVSLRGLMKKVQLYTINKLVRQCKQLHRSKASEKKQKKTDRLVQEIGAIKGVKLDHAVKYALGNTKTFEEIAAKGDLDTRAKVRLSTHPLMAEQVKKWRESHEDWKDLAAFIMYKNTGRRYKKKKKKDKEIIDEHPTNTEVKKPHKKSKAIVDDKTADKKIQKKEEVLQRIKAGQTAKELARKAKTAFNRHNKNEDEETQPLEKVQKKTSVEGSENENEKSEDSEDDEEEYGEKDEEEVDDEDEEEGGEEESKNKSVDGEDNDEVDEEEEEEEENEEEKEDDSSSEYEVEDKSECDYKKEGRLWKVEHTASKTKEDTAVKSPKPASVTKAKPKPIGHNASKEMTIKKIDLTSLSAGVEDIPLESNVNLFVSEQAKDVQKKKPKKKDAFFAMDNSDSESDNGDQQDLAVHHDPDRSDNEDHDMGSRRRQQHRQIESSFVGRLSDKQAKGDWGINKVSRGARGHGRRAFSTGRGSGQGRDFPHAHGGYQGRQSGQNKRDEKEFYKNQDDNPHTKKGAVEEKLHPSWEAKRKRKEMENKIVESQGKKIKFDD